MSVPSSGRTRFGEKMTAHIELWLWRKCSGASPGTRARSASGFKPPRPYSGVRLIRRTNQPLPCPAAGFRLHARRCRRAHVAYGATSGSRPCPGTSALSQIRAAVRELRQHAACSGARRDENGARCVESLASAVHGAGAGERSAWLEYAKARSLGEPGSNLPAEPAWTTRNSIRLELPTMRVREFFRAPTSNPATLIIAPFALHGATIADFAPGHSIVEMLQHAGGLASARGRVEIRNAERRRRALRKRA